MLFIGNTTYGCYDFDGLYSIQGLRLGDLFLGHLTDAYYSKLDQTSFGRIFQGLLEKTMELYNYLPLAFVFETVFRVGCDALVGCMIEICYFVTCIAGQIMRMHH